MDETIPAPMREFRGVWIATVDNIDWPSKKGLSTDVQRKELLSIIKRADADNLNAIVFQIRPACDALYPSSLEPWSEYLTGTMGKAPEPLWDPLEFAVDECHKRGIELHAWFNPYRAHHPSGKSPISADHISKTKPGLVRTYGKHLWLDPGEQGVQDHSAAVVMDVVKRYDIDGVHIDDYFYPYKERDDNKRIIGFPDEVSYQRYSAGGGTMSRDDWRRENVNVFIERIYREIKGAKPWVKFGISPFGIWRPGYPSMVKGFDAYTELYADARKWINNGWCDYLTPQLYWRIAQPAQPYRELLKWWVGENKLNRHIWPGNYTSNVTAKDKGWSAEELVKQVIATRAQSGATGNIHFSAIAFMKNREGVEERLRKTVYASKALVPASVWLDSEAPKAPIAEAQQGTSIISWRPVGTERAFNWVLYTRTNGVWSYKIVPGATLTASIPDDVSESAVSAVDRNGNESARTSVELKTRVTFGAVDQADSGINASAN